METCFTPLNAAFHALSDPTRRAVISRLMTSPAPVKELAAPFAMGLPAFLKHLRVLENSGLITTEKTGRTRTCRVQMARLEEACRTGVEDETFRRVAATRKVPVNYMSRADFTAMVRSEYEAYGRILRDYFA